MVALTHERVDIATMDWVQDGRGAITAQADSYRQAVAAAATVNHALEAQFGDEATAALGDETESRKRAVADRGGNEVVVKNISKEEFELATGAAVRVSHQAWAQEC